MGIAHWDEVESLRRDRAPMSGEWTDLGSAAGSVNAGVQRIRLAAGEMPTPPHVHGSEEEIFYVLDGSGLSWQDGKAYEIRAGDCIVHRATEEAHTLRGGDGGLDVLAFGERRPPGYGGYLPRARAAWLWPAWAEVTDVADMHPWQREAEAGVLEFPQPETDRPSTIVHVDDPRVRVTERLRTRIRAVWRDLGRAAGSETSGLKHIVVEPGYLSVGAHVHSAEEEIFVVLEGDGQLELTPSPSLGPRMGSEDRALGEEPTTHAVRTGSVVARPAGTRVAHTLRAGERGMTLLAYGTRDPNDMAYAPHSNKIFFRGLGLIGRLEPLGYWDGED